MKEIVGDGGRGSYILLRTKYNRKQKLLDVFKFIGTVWSTKAKKRVMKNGYTYNHP